METLQVPITAIVSICLGCGVLAVALVDSGFWPAPVQEMKAGERVLSTQGERLVRRYLKNNDYTYSELMSDMKVYFGDMSEELVLRETRAAVEVFPRSKLDRLYSLRGLAFRAMGREKKAMEAFRKALRLNPNNMTARVNLAVSRVEKQGDDAGLEELEKTLGNEMENMADDDGLKENSKSLSRVEG